MSNIPQLLKWIGNKHRFAEEIISYMPDNINRYIEPFLGSGAVLGILSSKQGLADQPQYTHAFGSDILPYVIDIFNFVRDNPEIPINYYKQELEGFEDDRKNRYLTIRDRFNVHKSSLDFLLLSRTCYSGVIRFRQRDGYMSTPIGPHKPISADAFKKRVQIWNDLIQRATFVNDDFEEIMSIAEEGDVIYCDPPYTHSQSILYGAHSFDINRLYQAIYDAKIRGAKVLLSINGTKKSGREFIGITPPEGLFERVATINCGVSMVNRLQNSGDIMQNEEVKDMLFMTW